jgi:hypothetical protein
VPAPAVDPKAITFPMGGNFFTAPSDARPARADARSARRPARPDSRNDDRNVVGRNVVSPIRERVQAMSLHYTQEIGLERGNISDEASAGSGSEMGSEDRQRAPTSPRAAATPGLSAASLSAWTAMQAGGELGSPPSSRSTLPDA